MKKNSILLGIVIIGMLLVGALVFVWAFSQIGANLPTK